MSDQHDLALLFKSRHTLIFARGQDEERLLQMVRAAAHSCSLPVWTWSAARGLVADVGIGGQYKTDSLGAAAKFIEPNMRGIYVFLDADAHLDDEVAVRQIKEIAQRAEPDLALVLAVHSADVPPALEGIAMPWKPPPASRTELKNLVKLTIHDLTQRRFPVSLTEDDIEQIVTAIQGLSDREAARIINEAALRDGGLHVDDLPYIRSAKASLLGDDGVLELYEPTLAGLDDVGGMRSLKEWLALRGSAFQPGAKEFGLEPPRGVLITGVPGCGKSLMAKALARTWGMPLVLLDPGRLFGPYVGQTEQRLQDALDTIEALAPCVLWIDELEKGFGGDGSSHGDGGVAMRVRGTFLRWLQDRPEGVFVVATSNQVMHLPPEFLRKGRFDEIFFVDLPGPAEREQILSLHLVRRKREPSGFDLAALVAASDGFSGSELEAAVVGGLYRAFALKQNLSTEVLLQELAATTPLSQTRAEDIQALRAWAKDRAVFANGRSASPG